MNRKKIDVLFSLGGFGLAVLLLILGAVLSSNAAFAKTYVKEQLSEQQINFKTAGTLTAEEKESACLVKYAGKALTTGKQAECYANDFIGLHTQSSAEGRTYSTQGDYVTGLKGELADAQAMVPVDVAKAAELNQKITAGTAARETLFKGETLRGLLLTSYGFSVFGEKGGQAAAVSYLVGALMLLLTFAGLRHAARTEIVL